MFMNKYSLLAVTELKKAEHSCSILFPAKGSRERCHCSRWQAKEQSVWSAENNQKLAKQRNNQDSTGLHVCIPFRAFFDACICYWQTFHFGYRINARACLPSYNKRTTECSINIFLMRRVDKMLCSFDEYGWPHLFLNENSTHTSSSFPDCSYPCKKVASNYSQTA